ncbi:fluoride efflux transporter FluC [Chryseomicrobium palamuruense]|uniref:Fluoride-specific ion channel FluC n=1 Tax=Chryseomicrobium palamuruense TaxID=682973 RepID=A0ABV8UX48_9BACL
MFAVFLGGAIGSILRAIPLLLIPGVSSGFPLSTLLVNWLGSAGIAIAYLHYRNRSPNFFQRFWMTGFFGGFTTMSIFSFDSLILFQTEEWLLLMGYILLTLLGSVGIVKWMLLRGGETT